MKKIFTLFCIGLCFNLLFVARINNANAWTDAPNLVVNGVPAVTTPIISATTGSTAITSGGTLGTTGTTSVGVFTQIGNSIATAVKANLESMIITGLKVAALMTVQKITQAIIGSGGGSGVVSDWNKYLYVSPQQRAMAQMNSFFNTVSRGRLSSLNYEGVGPNYDAYLVTQAKLAIAGRPFTTNLQDIATDPTQMFAGGNMKGLMTYMQCANNVACYTLTSTAQYNLEFAKAQEIAKNEQANGFLPVKKNGKITQPASIVSNAFMQVDQLGTQIIMNADNKAGSAAAIAQVSEGALISVGARTISYIAGSDEEKAAIKNKNDEFPFSLAYSTNGGIGLSAGGVKVNTGLAAANGNVQIGNTCATGAVSADGLGNTTTMVNGQKVTCPKNQDKASVSGPSLNATAPSTTVGGQTVGGDTVGVTTGSASTQ